MRNKPGFANTNSPLESFNSRLKTDFFKRIVRSIGGALEIITKDLIPYLSESCKKFKKYPRYSASIEKYALTLTKKNFKKINNRIYNYTGSSGNKYKIKLNLSRYYNGCFCECSHFIKDGICGHLVAFSFLFDEIKYKNYSNEAKTFAIAKKKGRPIQKTKKAGEFN